jgi:hypothetical protein
MPDIPDHPSGIVNHLEAGQRYVEDANPDLQRAGWSLIETAKVLALLELAAAIRESGVAP